TEFTTLAKEHNAVNVGQGFPDTLPPKVLVDAVKSALSDDNFAMHQYTRGFGHPRLTNILAKLYSRLFNTTVDPMKDVTITVGGYNALFCAFFAFLNPGDEAVIIEPYFDCYSAQIEMAGARPVFVPLRLTKNIDNGSLSTSDFALDINELEMSITPKTKLIVLNNPNNPLGKVFTRDELNNIAKLAKKYNLIVISDEVYEWIVYPGVEMIRFASLPDMWERTLTIGSAGKAFSATGWKTGWAIGPDGLMKYLRALHQNCTYSCPTVLQEAVAIAFEKELDLLFTAQSYFAQMSNDLLRKRDRMNDFLSSVGMRPILPEGGYFMLADFSK
uniref:Aminotransferase class I/classII domain-containing protein n=1 Tax=Romanomermis culicivorax TaxID=13658 RepID=A0A915K3E7_ROMCU